MRQKKETNSGLVVGAEDVVDKALDDAGLASTDLANYEDLVPELLLHTVVCLCPCKTVNVTQVHTHTHTQKKEKKRRGEKEHKP